MQYAELIQELKDRMDIVEVAQQYGRVQKSGRNYKGLCPFHNERTPSFFIYPHTNTFHCFGCQANGSVIDLYAHYNGVDFKAAVERLRRFYGIAYVTTIQQQQDAIRARKMAAFMERKRRELSDLLQGWLQALQDWLQSIMGFNSQSLLEYERYGDLYHVITKLEYYLYVIESIRANEVQLLRRLYEQIPKYLLSVYYQYFDEGEQTDDQKEN